jgi:hypothetical protein
MKAKASKPDEQGKLRNGALLQKKDKPDRTVPADLIDYAL